MTRAVSAGGKPALSSAFFRSLLITLAGTIFAASLSADRFRGQVRHEFLENIPVGGAQLQMVDAADPTQSVTLVTDELGHFETSVFDAGDVVNIIATHPAYARETPEVTLATNDYFESILMTPLGNVVTDYHDIIVQISGAVTQLPLRNVPVEITQWDQGNNVVATYNIVTDTKGVAIQRGVPTGSYEFKINDSSLPDADRQPRYEDYATPLLGRIDISQNHFTNVYLKPLTQDLKVRVRGYDFKEKESDAALENVLVEIRGLDPHDTNLEVLHPRSDFTVIFPEGQGGVPGPGESIDDSLFYLDNGEVVFKDLPPAAYEIKVSRYGYITKRIILQPDPLTGILPNSYDSPLEVTLNAEGHSMDILLEYLDYLPPSFNANGNISGSGITGLGLKVLVVGLEGTNTEGLEYESTTIQNLNGETYAPIFEPMLSGRYRVYVDGLSTETNYEYNEGFDFYFPTGPDYDLVSSGQTIVEIPSGRTSTFPLNHRFPVEIETPLVTVRGQLMVADDVADSTVAPIFRPMANQTVVLTPNPVELNQAIPVSATVTTDATGYFYAQVLPGAYGIRLPGMTDYFGDEVIVRVGDAVRDRDANSTQSYEWPLAEEFPELPGATNLQAHRYFELEGIPIHAARDQFLELRIRRETYMIAGGGTEDTEFRSRVLAITDDGTPIPVDYSPTLANRPTATITGPTGSFNTSIVAPPLGSFTSETLYVRWEGLPPGDYGGDFTATIPAHELADTGISAKTFIDWPEPGAAPTPEQGILFDVNSFPNNEFPWEPLVPVPGPIFRVNMTEYDSTTYDVYDWVERLDENNELVGDYELFGPSASRFMSESDGNFFVSPSLGGPVNAVWTFGRDQDDNTYPVRMEAGGRINIGGPNATPATPLPDLSYTLLVDGVSNADRISKIDGANYLNDSGITLITGTPEFGIRAAPSVFKAGGDNFVEIFQSRFEVTEPVFGIEPLVTITVGLSKGMQIKATLTDKTPTGSQMNPIDIPGAGVPVTIRDRFGNAVDTRTTNENGEVNFEALPGLADYFLTVDQSGYTPLRRLLLASEAIESTDVSTSSMHDVTQDITLLPRPTLINPGVPHNRWGLFLPTVSRSGNVEAEKGINNFDFFAAKEALTTSWKVEADPYQLNVSLPSYAGGDGAYGEPETLAGPDNIVAAYLIDERRFQKDGFTGTTDPLENETVFAIPADDEPAELGKLIALIKDATQLQSDSGGSSGATTRQRRVFVDPADKIEIDATTGRTTVTGSFALWDLPPGEFDPVIVLETQRGAYKVYDVPYQNNDANKRLRGPNLPPWFANILDLLGVASGVASTQGRVQEALKDYVPEDNFVPLPDFSMNIEVDKEDPEVDEGYLNYSLALAVTQEIGQESKGEGIIAMGPGIVGAKTKVEGKLGTNGKDGTIEFTIGGSITAENLVDEAYGTKIAPVGGSSVSFENPTGKVSTTASTNFGTNANSSDPLKFSLSATAGVGAKAKVSATLNNYARGIPYAGPVIGVLGDTNLAKLDAFIEGRAAISQTYTINTEFPRETKLATRLRTEAVPQQSFLGETKLELNSKTCIGIGFGTGLELTGLRGLATGKVAFEVGGGGCGVSDDIGTMELTFNTTNGWPLITNIKGEAKVTANASAGIGPAAISGKWEFAKAKFEVQFGTETVVTHFPFTADFLLSNDLAIGEGIFVDIGPELVGGLAPAANVNVNGAQTDTVAFTTVDPSGQAVLQIARRNGDNWTDPIEVPLAPQIGVSDTLTLGDGRTLIVYSVIAEGQDPHDPYADHLIFSRIIEVDGTVGGQTYVAYISNPIDQLALAESGSLVEMHIKAPATDGTQNYWQMFLTPFNKADDSWGTTQFRVNETDNFEIYLTSGGASGADEILLHWVTDSGVWNWMRTTDTDRQTVTGTFTAPPASWATAGFYEHVAATRDGRILRYGQLPFSGGPSERDTPLVEGVIATEVGLSQQSVTTGGGYLLAWVERSGNRQELAYMTYGPDGIPVLGRQAITENSVGSYSDLILSQQDADTAFVFSRFTQDDFSSLRSFKLDLVTGLASNDADMDNLLDIAELRIIDADQTDAFETIDQILDGDDFDNDGATNGDEIRAGSDPANPLSVPTPAEITSQPVDITVAAGAGAQFSVTANGNNLSYQWRRNGVPITGETSPTLTITATQSSDAAIYDVVVGGTLVSDEARLTVTGGDTLPSAVIATMAVAERIEGTGLVHLPFLIDGTGTKSVLVRVLGPAMSGEDAAGRAVVQDPFLVLRDRLGNEIGRNDNWTDSSDNGVAAQDAGSVVGALPLGDGSLDAALFMSLAPGHYTLEAGAAEPGLIYLELFDLDSSSMPDSRLASLGLHARGNGSGFAPSLGFVVSSPGDRDLVSRYLGPVLGLTGTLPDPALELTTAAETPVLIGANDNWETAGLPTRLVDSIRGVRLSVGGLDAARVDRLVSGSYLLNANIPAGNNGFGMLELIDPLAQENAEQIAVVVPPASQSVNAGSSATFMVLATGPGDLTYQWDFGGQPISDATGLTLNLNNVQPDDEGTYSVDISSSGETVTSVAANLTVLGGGPVRATQSSDVSTTQPEGSVTITVEIEWDDTPLGLSYETTLPEGWIMRSQTATGTLAAPVADATGELIWEFGTPAGDSPLSFTFVIEAPTEFNATIALEGMVSHEPTTGNVVESEALPHPLRIGVSPGIHDADTDGDMRLSLSELLRVIEIYNTRLGTTRTGRYRLQGDTVDGFAPDSSTAEDGTLTRYHTADTNRDAKLSLSELLRVIEIYNTRSGTTRTGAYRPADNTADGFEPDTGASG
ncbi:MAG: hypothetical protein SynsKO_08870 [Synoicihabitans sp.]